MGAAATILVLISAFMHAGWNLLVRRRGGEQACLLRMQVFVVAAGAVPAVIGLVLLHGVPAKAALCLLVSGASCALYYLFLGRAYESGDFTTVYPAVRALPVLLVGLGDAVRGRAPTGLGWVAMGLVASGCLLVPLTSAADVRLRHYLKPVSAWILLAALGTVGYSLADKVGTEAMPRGPGQAALYCYLFFVATIGTFVPLRALMPKSKVMPVNVGWLVPAAAGTLCFLAYGLVLWAYQMTAKASYVVAFRQFSIVIGVVIAWMAFNEPGKGIRLTGAIVITVGLVLLKLYGS